MISNSDTVYFFDQNHDIASQRCHFAFFPRSRKNDKSEGSASERIHASLFVLARLNNRFPHGSLELMRSLSHKERVLPEKYINDCSPSLLFQIHKYVGRLTSPPVSTGISYKNLTSNEKENNKNKQSGAQYAQARTDKGVAVGGSCNQYQYK